MEHLICGYLELQGKEENASNAFTNEGVMGYIANDITHLFPLMKQVLNVNFQKIPESLYKQEIDRISSEFNLRTFNYGIDYFFQ